MNASFASKRLSRALLVAAAPARRSAAATAPSLSRPPSSSAPESDGTTSSLFHSPWSVLQQRGVKVRGSDVRPGNVVERKGRLYEVVKADHNQQGRGSAMIQVELRDVESGNKVNARFNTDESVEKIFVEEKSFTCMCTMGDEVALIDPQTFEQVDVKRDLFGKSGVYLKEEMKVMLRFFDDRPLSGSVPKRVICTVVDTPPPLKGVSAAPAEKRALLDNGLTVKVPAFIEGGEAILVNTEEDSYMSR
ncbi:elongation factor P isoform X2 [Rhodamnia argentea]|nr:elongation factor P isoform X2 [Rhodamnia argentea]